MFFVINYKPTLVKTKIINGLIYISVIIAFIFSSISTISGQGINGSVHDFSAQGWSAGEICVVCHTPHGASTVVTPLWNHELSSATYTIYSSSTLDGPIQSPGRASKLCLSCHDGTIAVDSFGGASGGTFITGDASMGIDLSDDHPIGVEWHHQTLGDDGECSNCHVTIPIKSTDMPLPFYKENGTRAKVECSSCHDPHDNVDVANGYLLRESQVGSALCLHCHNK